MLRDAVEGDIEIFFEHQCDPDATSMAEMPAREWDAFVSHWRHKILGVPANKARTIVVDDQVVGFVASWEQEGARLVGYWIGRKYWGRGIAYAALSKFLRTHDHYRPIEAYVASSNSRSIRVLEKCGFERVGEPEIGPFGVMDIHFQLMEQHKPVKMECT